MRKILLSMVCLSLLVFALAGTSYAWQGRMAGAGDPYGLLSDESDFLIHPAKIAQGEGIKFYGHYRFTYTDVMAWDYSMDLLTPAGVLADFYHFDTSGQEYNHNGLLGAATPLGPGRFGIFFTYDGMQGNYDGDEVNLGGSANFAQYDLRSDFNNFALRLLYGLPVGGFNLGGEVQFAYRGEENENWQEANDMSIGWLNYILGTTWLETNLLPFQLPYDSSYWEALFKGSLEGMVGPLDLEFTLRGGFIFAGDNDLATERTVAGPGSANLDGGVNGWQIGGDLWVRYAAGGGLALPFVVRVDYKEKSRDGDGPGMGNWAGLNYDYDNEERDLQIEVGGGVDKELGTGTRVAGGIYYNYLQGVKNISIREANIGWSDWDSTDYPASTEHRVIVRLAGEHEFTPTVALRMGLGFFYGWVQEDFKHVDSSNGFLNFNDDISLSGSRLGIGGSVGGSLSFNNFTMEPFINGGWQQIDLDGDGSRTNGSAIINLWDKDLSRNEWYIGGGCSFLYDMP